MKSTKRRLTTARRADKPARIAYCTGCANIFGKMHELINHRRSNACGGRFLPEKERDFVNVLRLERERQLRHDRFMAEMASL